MKTRTEHGLPAKRKLVFLCHHTHSLTLPFLVKVQLTEWDSVLANHPSCKGITSIRWKELSQLNSRRIDNRIGNLAKDLRRHFSKEDLHECNTSYIKRSSASLISREMRVRSTRRPTPQNKTEWRDLDSDRRGSELPPPTDTAGCLPTHSFFTERNPETSWVMPTRE